MEPGSAPGTIRFSLTTLYGSDFEGGHFSREGNTSDGRSIEVPLYRHEVSLDYARIELGLQYTIAPQWDLIARLPWEQKSQTSSATLVAPATPAEHEAMQHNIDLHHRTVTLRGLSDVMLLARRHWTAVRRPGDILSLAAGLTIPTGRTIENPYLLGDQGQRHLHIQSGTGTVDPLFELTYSTPISPRLATGAYLSTRLPLYGNSHTFKAAPEATLSLHLTRHTTPRLRLRADAALYAQGYAHWSGTRDENTGLLSTTLGTGATWLLTPTTTLSADVRYPVSQRTLIQADAFTQGPTVTITVGGRVR